MKKITITLIVPFLLTATISFAQNDKAFRFGLKGSPTLAWMKPEINITESQALTLTTATGLKEYTSEGMTFGFSYGIMGEFRLADNYSIVTGIDVTYNGGKLKYPHKQTIGDTIPTFGTLDRKFNLKYLELPLMLKMKTNEIGYITYFGQFGFGTSFNLSAKADDKYVTGNENITREDVDIKELKEISFFRESLIIGLGIEYSFGGSTSAILGINFNNGFTDVLRGENDVITGIKEKAKSNYLEVNIGILF